MPTSPHLLPHRTPSNTPEAIRRGDIPTDILCALRVRTDNPLLRRVTPLSRRILNRQAIWGRPILDPARGRVEYGGGLPAPPARAVGQAGRFKEPVEVVDVGGDGSDGVVVMLSCFCGDGGVGLCVGRRKEGEPVSGGGF